MSRPRLELCSAALLVVVGWSSRAGAQACCAGGSALTPGRLERHESVLVGAQVRAATVFGSYDPDRHYTASPSGATEYDFEEDVFASVRFLRAAQASLLVPIHETRRATPSTGSEIGGGVGDVNLSARYDFLLPGLYRYIPGFAALAGVTFPTGTPPEKATTPLATGATGIGAFQGHFGLAVEQSWGPWLVNLTGLVAKRTSRTVQGGSETLGTQWTLLGGGAYVFESEAAIALFVSYAASGDATRDGVDEPGTGRALTTITASGVLPLGDRWRLLGSVFLNPPTSALGHNDNATAGTAFTVIRSWI